MGWKFQEAKTTSYGVASFEYSIVLSDEDAKIVAETSTVKEDPPAAASSSLGQVRRSIQQLLGKLSKPAKRPAKVSTKASTQAPTQASIRPKVPVAR
jgi:hypothetical protein